MSNHRHPQVRFVPLGVLALAALVVTGCPDDVVDANDTGTAETGDTGGVGYCEYLPGTLVISEIVANPPGSDDGGEWFEIYNASAEAKSLNGLALVYADFDGDNPSEHFVDRDLEIPAGGYLVFGSVLDNLTDEIDHIDYGFGDDLGAFGNQNGRLSIECMSVVDMARYAYDEDESSDKASRSLSGVQPPDAVINDDLDNWCDSQTAWTEDYAATPGAPNDACGDDPVCLLDGELVDVIPPAPGDLVITEILANPTEFADGDAEWFEIHSLAESEFHLNGVEIGKVVDEEAEDQVTGDCIVIAPGDYAIIAAGDDPTLNGELPAEALVYVTSMALTNGESSLWLGSPGGELLDAVNWTGSSEGVSSQLSADKLDPVENDNALNWCDSTEAWAPIPNPNNWGSPGAPNEVCEIEKPPPMPGNCYEGVMQVPIMPLAPGDLEITEYLADTDCTEETKGEWFELRAHASGHLNGLQFGKDEDWKGDVDSDDCIAINADDYIVFGRSDDITVNGNVVVDVVHGMGLTNGASDLIIGYGMAAMPDDQVSWDGNTPGVAMSKDADGVWCEAKAPIAPMFVCVDPNDPSDLGTPGLPNPSCSQCIDPDTDLPRMIVPPQMGDIHLSEIMANPGGADPGEEWFEIHNTAVTAIDLNGMMFGKDGVLTEVVESDLCVELPAEGYAVLSRADAPTCDLVDITYVYDGVSLTNGGDQLDIGYDNQIWDTHIWDATTNKIALSYDPMAMSWCDAIDPIAGQGCEDLGTPAAANPECGMGNNMGFCLDGMMMREVVPPVYGDLVIAEFMADPANDINDNVGEWFEVHALGSFDLNGLVIGNVFMNDVDEVIDSNQCLVMSPGDNFLFARNGDDQVNGGMDNVGYVYPGPGLVNGGGSLYLALPDGDQPEHLLDTITWTGSSTGSSTSLDPGSLDPDLNDVADNVDPWCYASQPYGVGNNGSPGVDNPSCN